jgi:hypothetical protein
VLKEGYYKLQKKTDTGKKRKKKEAMLIAMIMILD